MPAPVDHDSKRAQIASIAADLIAARGLEAATIREVAARAGYSTTAVTHYFANKRAMLLAAYQHMAQAAGRRFDETATSLPHDPLARLETLLPVDEDSRRAWQVYFQFWPMANHDAALAAEQKWWNRNAIALAAQTLREAYPDVSDVDQKAPLALSALQGIALQALFDPEEWPPERQRAMWRAHAALLLT